MIGCISKLILYLIIKSGRNLEFLPDLFMIYL
jgi:hypothetical protein